MTAEAPFSTSRPGPFTRSAPPTSVLVVRLGAIGDVVRTLPAVRLLRRAWPGARLAWAIEPAGAALLGAHPDLDELVVLERGAIASAARRLSPAAAGRAARFVSRLRGLRADLSLDFQASLKSALVARASGARVRVGFDRAHAREMSHLFANVRVRLARDRIHRVQRAALLARAAGADDGPLVADLALSEDERRAGRARVAALVPRTPVVALAPMSSRRQAWKRYPPGLWVRVARGLAAERVGVVVLGGPGEEDETLDICRSAGDGVVASGPIGLRDLASLVAATDLFVGGDTGPMHIAWSCGVPVVAVYGPTDPVLNAPFGSGHVVLAPERPTGRGDADPFPGIDPGLIVDRARSLLREPRPRAPETRT